MTKHEKLLNYIKDLKVGDKISVRQLASKLQVSEGTAYRAIKDAERDGYVCTMPRVGTVRIEKKEDSTIEQLTFAEVVNIVDGSIMGGKDGLHNPLNKFLIGAMEVENMKPYIEAGSLLIVGNRRKAQKLALKYGAAVLITGGFKAEEDVIKLADNLKIPLISSAYDTFTVATLINQALNKRLVKKDIVQVKDVMVKKPYYLEQNQTIEDWGRLYKTTGHSKFPVTDSEGRVVGIVTTKDTAKMDNEVSIFEIMSKDPIVVSKATPVAHVAHLMVWEGIEIIPVVENKKLVGIITRQDAIKALHHMSYQPQIGQTIDGLIMNQFTPTKTETGMKLEGTINPVMLNPFGVASCGVLTTVMANAGIEAFRLQENMETVPDSFTVYFTRPIQLEQEIEVKADIIDVGRKSGKAEISLSHKGKLVAMSLISVRAIDR